MSNENKQPDERAAFETACDALPEGVNWGDGLTPEIVRHILARATTQQANKGDERAPLDVEILSGPCVNVCVTQDSKPKDQRFDVVVIRKTDFDKLTARTAAPQAVTLSDEQRVRVRDAIAEAIGGDAYDCTRAWSAWGVGTMSADDFYCITDDGERLMDIADTAIAAILAAHPTEQREPDDPQIIAAANRGYAAGLKDGKALGDLTTEQRMSDAEDAARLDWLREECCDLRSISVPTGGDDADVNWIVIQHHMAEPREREIGRGFSDDPRDAIDAARKGDSQ